jgi:hypothetical protein
MLTKPECQKILFKIGIELGVSPKLIATRLLSEEDKQDMMNGDLSIEALTCHVKAWKENGMADYANGNTEPMKLTKG